MKGCHHKEATFVSDEQISSFVLVINSTFVVFQGEFEIVGDTVHPNGDGASLSRLTRKKIFSGLKTRFTGDSNSFCKGKDSVVHF